jgi:hypothetical protein
MKYVNIYLLYVGMHCYLPLKTHMIDIECVIPMLKSLGIFKKDDPIYNSLRSTFFSINNANLCPIKFEL